MRVCEVDRFLGLFTLELEVLTAKAQKTVRGLSACVCVCLCVWQVDSSAAEVTSERLLHLYGTTMELKLSH